MAWSQCDHFLLSMDVKNKKPYILKGLAWGTFSGTATASAFLLPAFIMGNMLYGQNFSDTLPEWLLQSALILIVGCAIYHSVYRIIASDHDLKLIKVFTKYFIVFILITLLFLL